MYAETMAIDAAKEGTTSGRATTDRGGPIATHVRICALPGSNRPKRSPESPWVTRSTIAAVAPVGEAVGGRLPAAYGSEGDFLDTGSKDGGRPYARLRGPGGRDQLAGARV